MSAAVLIDSDDTRCSLIFLRELSLITPDRRTQQGHAGNLLPGDFGTTLLRLVEELLDRLADALELAETASWRIRSAMNASRPTAAYEVMLSIASRM